MCKIYANQARNYAKYTKIEIKSIYTPKQE